MTCDAFLVSSSLHVVLLSFFQATCTIYSANRYELCQVLRKDLTRVTRECRLLLLSQLLMLLKFAVKVRANILGAHVVVRKLCTCIPLRFKQNLSTAVMP